MPQRTRADLLEENEVLLALADGILEVLDDPTISSSRKVEEIGSFFAEEEDDEGDEEEEEEE